MLESSLPAKAMGVFAMQTVLGDNQASSLWRQALGKLNVNVKDGA